MDEELPVNWTFHGKQWKYRGEGNANLVIAVPQERKVVRFRKSEDPCARDVEREVRHRIGLEVEFCRRVMRPLMGDCFVQQLSMAYVEPPERQELATQLRAVRPAHRLHKDICGSHVAVCLDCSMLPSHLTVSLRQPTFCVELKPKQGWIAVPDRVLPKCTFCLKQHLKLKKGIIKSHSKYCPLDLFSGNHKRMKGALKALLACPQNNLRIFQDGTLVYGEDKSGMLENVLQKWLGNASHFTNTQRLVEKFCHLMLAALTREVCSQRQVPASEAGVPQLPPGHLPAPLVDAVAALASCEPCDWSAAPLPPGCVLSSVLEVQRLDQGGLQAALDARPRAAPQHAYLEGLLSDLGPLQRYLLAASARDCSIMVAFQSLPATFTGHIPTAHIIREMPGREYVFNVQVLDLDPKPLSCIDKKLKRDLDILNVCVDVLGSVQLPCNQLNGKD
ncbi:inositol-pentakisphosphate 2-kinase isoform X2 [Bacillus rossius redtenbacheri]